MIARLLVLCMAVASAAVLAFLAVTALTPNPNAPEVPRTWPTTEPATITRATP